MVGYAHFPVDRHYFQLFWVNRNTSKGLERQPHCVSMANKLIFKNWCSHVICHNIPVLTTGHNFDHWSIVWGLDLRFKIEVWKGYNMELFAYIFFVKWRQRLGFISHRDKHFVVIVKRTLLPKWSVHWQLLCRWQVITEEVHLFYASG